MIHDVYMADELLTLDAPADTEWDRRLRTDVVLARIDTAVRNNPAGEQLIIVVRSYEPDGTS